jgi:hypothetical protein
MSETVTRILDEVEQLSVAEREELADRLAQNLAHIQPVTQAAQITESAFANILDDPARWQVVEEPFIRRYVLRRPLSICSLLPMRM